MAVERQHVAGAQLLVVPPAARSPLTCPACCALLLPPPAVGRGCASRRRRSSWRGRSRTWLQVRGAAQPAVLFVGVVSRAGGQWRVMVHQCWCAHPAAAAGWGGVKVWRLWLFSRHSQRKSQRMRSCMKSRWRGDFRHEQLAEPALSQYPHLCCRECAAQGGEDGAGGAD